MKPNKIIIHHTASSRDNTKITDVENWHKLRWPNFISSLGWHIGYHYLITSDGAVNQTRKDDEIGAHSPPNEGKIGICLTGNFMIESPSKAQLEALESLIERLKMTYGIKEVRGHRDINRTLCPGDELYKWTLQYRINYLKVLIQKLLNLFKKNV